MGKIIKEFLSNYLNCIFKNVRKNNEKNISEFGLLLLSVIIPVRNEISYISKSFSSIINASSKVESELFFY